MTRFVPGLNIQWPISELILNGEKTVETRTYPIPTKYLDQDMLMIETPGKSGQFKARIVGVIVFSSCFKYPSKKAFENDYAKHLVSDISPWAWNSGQKKWGWTISKIKKFKTPRPAPSRRGIVFCNIPSS